VNAILAVCATQPEIGTPEYYHVNSGARNPLTFKDLYTYIRAYFHGPPLRGRSRGRGPAAAVDVPGASSIERLLSTSERAHKIAERVLARHRALTGLARSPRTWIAPGCAWISCGAITRSTRSTRNPSCTSSTTTPRPHPGAAS
jgi:hypothetical protein